MNKTSDSTITPEKKGCLAPKCFLLYANSSHKQNHSYSPTKNETIKNAMVRPNKVYIAASASAVSRESPKNCGGLITSPMVVVCGLDDEEADMNKKKQKNVKIFCCDSVYPR